MVPIGVVSLLVMQRREITTVTIAPGETQTVPLGIYDAAYSHPAFAHDGHAALAAHTTQQHCPDTGHEFFYIIHNPTPNTHAVTIYEAMN